MHALVVERSSRYAGESGRMRMPQAPHKAWRLHARESGMTASQSQQKGKDGKAHGGHARHNCWSHSVGKRGDVAQAAPESEPAVASLWPWPWLWVWWVARDPAGKEATELPGAAWTATEVGLMVPGQRVPAWAGMHLQTCL